MSSKLLSLERDMSSVMVLVSPYELDMHVKLSISSLISRILYLQGAYKALSLPFVMVCNNVIACPLLITLPLGKLNELL